jgi:RNA polymerase sigma-70 factor (ECF subfamily)
MMITRHEPLLTLDEEQILVTRAQSGDARSMDRLLGAHYQQMFHLALKVTRDGVKAQDVTQEACVQVLRRIDQFRSESRFGSWLCRIVVNTALLRHRREKRLVPTEEVHAPADWAPVPGPEQLSADREVLLRADAVLDSLRDGDRDLFIRRFLDGLSLQDISAESGLSLPALKSRFHRARLRLKDEAESNSWGMAFAA